MAPRRSRRSWRYRTGSVSSRGHASVTDDPPIADRRVGCCSRAAALTTAAPMTPAQLHRRATGGASSTSLGDAPVGHLSDRRPRPPTATRGNSPVSRGRPDPAGRHRAPAPDRGVRDPAGQGHCRAPPHGQRLGVRGRARPGHGMGPARTLRRPRGCRRLARGGDERAGRRPLRGGPHPAPGGTVELRDRRHAGSLRHLARRPPGPRSTRARTSAWSWRRGRGWRRRRPASPAPGRATGGRWAPSPPGCATPTASQRHRLLEAARPAAVGLMRRTADRETATRSGPWPLKVERELAGFSAWYEMFPRSEGAQPPRGGTFRSAAAPAPGHRRDGLRHRLSPPHPPDRAELPQGFATTAPTHSRGTSAPPGPIGAAEGGHTAIHPDLGTLDDFALLRRRGRAAWARGRPRLRAPVQPRPPLGDRAPGVVQPSRRRQHPLRGEPPQALPGHLPARLRHARIAPASGARSATSCSSGSTTASGCSGSTIRTPSRSHSGSG